MDENRLGVLRAVLQRIIPADEYFGACESGVDGFVLGLLDRELRESCERVEAGLDGVEAEAKVLRGAAFCSLESQQQDEILQAIEKGRVKTPWEVDPAEWFSRLITVAMEGFYSDPSNGGNKDENSWKMIGYDPGKARHGSWK